MKKRVYIDTSVVGGYFDEEFSTDTIPFFDTVKKGGMTIIVSDLLEAELLRAPKFVRQLIESLPIASVERIRLSPRLLSLQTNTLKRKLSEEQVVQTVSI